MAGRSSREHHSHSRSPRRRSRSSSPEKTKQRSPRRSHSRSHSSNRSSRSGSKPHVRSKSLKHRSHAHSRTDTNAKHSTPSRSRSRSVQPKDSKRHHSAPALEPRKARNNKNDSGKRRHRSPTQVSHKRRRARSRSPSSSPDDSSSSSSSSSGEDSDFAYTPAGASFGPVVGDTVTDKLKRKILNNTFIELGDLLPKCTNETDEMLAVTSDHQLKLKKKHNTSISFTDWSEAFDIFTSIYVTIATSRSQAIALIKEMFSFKKIVRNLMRQGYNWAEYDRHFRKDRESVPCSWASVRYDLMTQYAPSLTRPQSMPGAGQSAQRPPVVPLGFCIRYHTKFQVCSNKPCPYKHFCPRCQREHPAYKPCRFYATQPTLPDHNESQYKGPTTQNKKQPIPAFKAIQQ